MTDDAYDNVQIVGRHVPDVSIETDSEGQKTRVPLPGTYEVGFMLGSTFMPIATYKAGNVLNADGSPINPAETPASSPDPASSDQPSGDGSEQ